MFFRKALSLNKNLVPKFLFVLIAVGIPLNLWTSRSYDSSWTIGEWLISYAGGFTRRGLPGSLIHWITIHLNISPVHLVWILSVCFFIFLTGLLWGLRWRFDPSLLLSPMILLGPIIGGYLVRKDVMLLTLFGLCLLTVKRFITGKTFSWPGFILLNSASIAAILSHESYGFWAIPSVFLCILCRKHSKNVVTYTAGGIAGSAIYLLPSFLAFFACLVFKGSESQAISIHQAWQNLEGLIPPSSLLSRSLPSGAIDALGWTTSQGLFLSASTLNHFSLGIWIPAAWFLTIYICIQFFITDQDPQHVEAKRFIVLYQFLFISPLFILGWDFGRWIFLWITSSALLYGYLPSALDPNLLNTNSFMTVGRLMKKVNGSFPLHGKQQILLLLLGIPGCCWSVKSFLASTPIGYPLKVLKLVFAS